MPIPELAKPTSRFAAERAGKIVIKPPFSTIDVNVWDIWADGARIELPFEFELAEQFALVFVASRTMVEATLGLQTGRLARVRFSSAPRSIAIHKFVPLHAATNAAQE